MKLTTRLIVAMTAGALAAAAVAEESKPANGNVAVVNGVAIPQAKLDAQLKVLAARGQKDSPELRNAVKDSLITGMLIEQEAAKKGLDKAPEVQAELEVARQGVLFRAFVQDYFKSHPVADAEIKAEYDKFKEQQSANGKEYRARHILVKEEKQAKDILAQLKKGAKFDQLASKLSEDKGSAAKGGDLDWSAPSNYVKPFADALVKLQKGQVTEEPVKSEFGYHIIKLEDARNTPVPSLDELKPQISQFLQQKQLENLMKDLRAKAKVE
ncbi:peptidyl-prolyl cis-trans isomerase C [Chitinivorax tropicus]|uniref:peptidylprolyl isomerase n=1 Tax=Chitinivorax tropicus TaxID=714531 RepID=A0A840ME52_9PROT|nr:peptidylprolyl isomerase [Chitinivorax tropicus]MBB5016958.1 peptidyl-prolyl cis-trans isomerase C [Chitinivorax tropicus]